MIIISGSGPNVRLPARDWILLLAVAIAGMVAGTLASASLYLATPLALILVYSGAVKRARAHEVRDLYPHPDLPLPVQRAVQEAASQLPPGEARTLLARVVKQAVLLHQAHEKSVGELVDDRGMLADVAELVDSACAIAVQLSLLDAATGSDRLVDAESRRVRERFVESLTSAATVIRNLHVSVIQGGTVASDRATEITSDLRGEADARARAIAELAALLNKR
jgi:hypothetical protein